MAKEKGKNWYSILAPKYFGEREIGKTMANDPDLVKGKVVEPSLMELTGNPEKYYMKLFFKIIEVEGTKAFTVFFGHECTRDFEARIVQPRTERLDTNQIIQLKDGKIRIKTITIANRHVTAVIAKFMRKTVSELLAEKLREKTTEEYVKYFTEGSLQNEIRSVIKKIYPVRFFEILKTHVVK